MIYKTVESKQKYMNFNQESSKHFWNKQPVLYRVLSFISEMCRLLLVSSVFIHHSTYLFYSFLFLFLHQSPMLLPNLYQSHNHSAFFMLPNSNYSHKFKTFYCSHQPSKPTSHPTPSVVSTVSHEFCLAPQHKFIAWHPILHYTATIIFTQTSNHLFNTISFHHEPSLPNGQQQFLQFTYTQKACQNHTAHVLKSCMITKNYFCHA